MDREEALEMLADMVEKAEEYAAEKHIRLRGIMPVGEHAIELARRGFVILGNLHDKPRELSVEEIEYMVARRNGNVQ